MRVAFVGASDTAIQTARLLVERGQEVVVVEASRARIDELSPHLDCGYVHGDGSRPAILRELCPKRFDVLFCLTDHDQDNILASLVGRSLGFPRVVTRIQDPELEAICRELGLEDTIVPSRTIGRYLADLVAGERILELSTEVRGEARYYSFRAGEGDLGAVEALGLPEEAAVVCLYREDRFVLARPGLELQLGDEVVVLTHSRNLPALRERWKEPATADSEGGGVASPAG